jgi:meso-butanediol dehydrogenase / (S,S)-butanediol dehydrogenase / diacetyl reductase
MLTTREEGQRMRLDGKVALITGGGSGIGAAVAERFVADGARVCVTGRRPEVLNELVQSLPSSSAVACPGDVSKLEDAQRMVETTLSFGGKLDILVNNAGIDAAGTVIDIDLETWRRVIETNLTGPFLLMKAGIPAMIKGGGGSVINVASLGGVRCLPGMPAYCSSKAGLIMLTQQAALDYGPFRVRCNVVCPGGTRTPMLEKSVGELGERMGTDVEGAFKLAQSMVPLRRVATPQEISGICSYLASDDSTFMTGSVILIDGGSAVVDVSGAVFTNAGINYGK